MKYYEFALVVVLATIVPALADLNGEEACEGKGYTPVECQDIGCCHWNDGECWSSVGTDSCNGGENNNEEDDLNGEESCQGKGYNKDECQDIGCCLWNDGECWSSVGTDSCNALTAEEACLDKGYNKDECQDIGCCDWYEGQCLAGIGFNLCYPSNVCSDNPNKRWKLNKKGKKKTCLWLSRKGEVKGTKICEKKKAARKACPDTCAGKCSE